MEVRDLAFEPPAPAERRYINRITNPATSARTRIAPTIQISRDCDPDVGNCAG
jgi:hypothetical protein